ncbi:MAG TPA: manganese efflux pump MntP family protein [Bacillota bacterium]|nr:manganese efflux pump MntP family protein [Bacillota bacterium]
MSFLTLLVLAVALGTDAFSLCVGIGLAGVKRRQILLISATVFTFHVFMPLTGWFLGEFTGSLLGRTAAAIGSLLLVYLGVRMVYHTLQNKGTAELHAVNFNTWGLFLLGSGVSLDALSVGFTLGARQADLVLTAGVIGVVAGVMTAGGLIFGRFLGSWVGKRAQLVGGLVLVGVGVKLFF